MIKVEEIMTRQVHALKESDSLYQARCLMRDKKIRHIPIVDNDNILTGLLTQRDLLAASESVLNNTSSETKIDLEKALKVSEAMTRNVNTITARTSLRGAALSLQEHKHGCLPVVEEGKVIGIITDTDFVSVAINLIEQQDLEMESFEDDF